MDTPSSSGTPTITAYLCPAAEDITTIAYTIPDVNATVSSVVLIAPPSDTHTFNMHQRLIQLPILAMDADSNHDAGEQGGHTVTVRGPPNVNIAPQGPYMLFLVSGNTYGPGQWVYVRDFS